VEPDGHVADVEIASDDMRVEVASVHAAFRRCVVDSVRRWRFKPAAASVKVSYPFSFEADSARSRPGAIAASSAALSTFRSRLRHAAGVKRCYRDTLEHGEDDGLSGRLIVEFVLDGDGHVAKLRAVESTLDNPKLVRCILSAMHKVGFPPSDRLDGVVVRYPFMFKPEE